MMTDTKSELLEAVLRAHAQSALRGNVSHRALQLAAAGSHSYVQAICAALMTLGGTHAPLLQTYDLLADPAPDAAAEILLLEGRRVPGWGNAFVKDAPDPIWTPVEELFPPDMRLKIERVTLTLHARGKAIYPNPSCFTAAVGLIMDFPREVTPYLFICGRLGAWTNEYARVRELP